MEYYKEMVKIWWKGALSVTLGLLGVCGGIASGPPVLWSMLVVIGGSGLLLWAILLFYAAAAELHYRAASGRALVKTSYRGTLRKLRKERRKKVESLYESRGYSTLHRGYLEEIQYIDQKIAKHMGLDS